MPGALDRSPVHNTQVLVNACPAHRRKEKGETKSKPFL